MDIDLAGVPTFPAPNSAAPPVRRDAEEELGRTAFLELMIAQISNQDPLEPAKNEAFIAQLAQFSSVEGLQNLNESMDTLVASLRGSIAMDAASLVGHNVLVETSETLLNAQGGIVGGAELPQASTNVSVQIANSSGQLVAELDLGSRPPGDLRFEWDGKLANGEQATADRYRIIAVADIDGQPVPLVTNLPDRVVSVSIEEGGLIANLAGGAAVPAVQIKEIQ